MLKMSKRRLFPKPVCQITVNNEPVESAMVKGIPASSFFESSKSDRWRRLAFKSRIELDFFVNFVKKRSFKWLLWLKTGYHLLKKGKFSSKKLRVVSVIHFSFIQLRKDQVVRTFRFQIGLFFYKNLRVVPVVRVFDSKKAYNFDKMSHISRTILGIYKKPFY